MSFIHRTKAKRTVSGYSSKLEEALKNILLLRERSGEIRNIKEQVTFKLTKAQIRIRIDFTFEDCKTGEIIACEAKGLESDRWGIIKRLWPYYAGIKLEIWKGSHLKPKLDKIIEPVLD